MDESLREALAELEDYLDGVQPDRAAELALPFAARWILPELGFDLARLREEAETFVTATPLSDRILASYPDHLAYWVSQRMLVDTDEAARHERARSLLTERARLLDDEGFARVAAALRHVLAGPDERIWSALALRIAESVLP